MEKQQKPFVFTPTRKKKSKAARRYEREQAAKLEQVRKAALSPSPATQLEELTLQKVPVSPWNDAPVGSWDTVSNFSTPTIMNNKPAPEDTPLPKAVGTAVTPTSAWDKLLSWGNPTTTSATKALLPTIPEDWEAQSKKQWAAERAGRPEAPHTEEQIRQEKLTEAMKGWPWNDQPEKQFVLVFLILIVSDSRSILVYFVFLLSI